MGYGKRLIIVDFTQFTNGTLAGERTTVTPSDDSVTRAPRDEHGNVIFVSFDAAGASSQYKRYAEGLVHVLNYPEPEEEGPVPVERQPSSGLRFEYTHQTFADRVIVAVGFPPGWSANHFAPWPADAKRFADSRLAVKYDLFKPDTIRLSWELQALGEGVDIQSEVQRIKRGENGAGEKTLLLLIHGLGGKAEATWGRFPTLLVENDPEFARDYRVAFFSYPTMLLRTIFSRKAPSIQELADALRTEIENRYAEYTSVVLVCHSLGGLIGRMYLLNEVKAQHPLRVRGIVLFAVPNNGADLAAVGKSISWQHRQLQQLCRNSEVIEQLNRDWFTMGLGDAVRAKYVTGTQDGVVDRFSATAIWGNPDVETIVGKGHIDIVKPERIDDGVVIVLKRFLREIAEAQRVRTHGVSTEIVDGKPVPLAPVAKETPELRPHLVSLEPGIEYLREEPNGIEPTTGYTKPGRNMALVATICNEPTNGRVGFAYTVRAQITYYDLLGNIYQRINTGVWISSRHFESIDLGPNDIGQLVLAVERTDKGGRTEFVLPCAEGTDPRNQADMLTVYPLELEGYAKPIRLAAEVTLRESQGYRATYLYTVSIHGKDSFVESSARGLIPQSMSYTIPKGIDLEAWAERNRICGEYLTLIATSPVVERQKLICQLASKLFDSWASRRLILVKTVDDIPMFDAEQRTYLSVIVMPHLSEIMIDEFDQAAINLSIAGRRAHFLHDVIIRVQTLTSVASGSPLTNPVSSGPMRRFAIALSFPGEIRDRAEQIADFLAGQLGRDKVFYDRYHEAELARPNLDIYLQKIYHDQTEVIVIFLSRDYERKEWCGLEWRAIRDLIKRRQENVMFVRSDDADVSGLFSIDGYLDIRNRSDRDVAELILARWRGQTHATQVVTEPGQGTLSSPPLGMGPFNSSGAAGKLLKHHTPQELSSRVTLQSMDIERAVDQSITYKLKLRIILKNDTGREITAGLATWRSGPDKLRIQEPPVFPLKWQVENDTGWDKKEKTVVHVPNGRFFRTWVGVYQSVTEKEFLKRHVEKKLGNLLLALNIDGEDVHLTLQL